MEKEPLYELVALLSRAPEALQNWDYVFRDSRGAKVKRLGKGAHPGHCIRKYDRRSATWGSYRKAYSPAFVNALFLDDPAFEELAKVLPVYRKLGEV